METTTRPCRAPIFFYAGHLLAFQVRIARSSRSRAWPLGRCTLQPSRPSHDGKVKWSHRARASLLRRQRPCQYHPAGPLEAAAAPRFAADRAWEGSRPGRLCSVQGCAGPRVAPPCTEIPRRGCPEPSPNVLGPLLGQVPSGKAGGNAEGIHGGVSAGVHGPGRSVAMPRIGVPPLPPHFFWGGSGARTKAKSFTRPSIYMRVIS